MKKNKIEDIELTLLLEAISLRYGYDLSGYTSTTIKRRLQDALVKANCENLADMIPKLLYDESFFKWLLGHFSITVTEWFRDPVFYQALREKVIPFLKTFPYFKIWHAGCATGEEVYSLAIILKEEGLIDRATIFATDFNDDALSRAAKGIYPVKDIQAATAKYQEAGGKGSLSEMLHANYDSAIVSSDLKENITFANHNLLTDTVFGEMHLILCRNVLIYFSENMQNRIYHLFNNSLIYKGCLCLGAKESLDFSEVREYYKTIDLYQKIYQKIIR